MRKKLFCLITGIFITSLSANSFAAVSAPPDCACSWSSPLCQDLCTAAASAESAITSIGNQPPQSSGGGSSQASPAALPSYTGAAPQQAATGPKNIYE